MYVIHGYKLGNGDGFLDADEAAFGPYDDEAAADEAAETMEIGGGWSATVLEVRTRP